MCEGALCYTGDLFDAKRSKYDLKYYVGLAKQLEKAGAHILGMVVTVAVKVGQRVAKGDPLLSMEAMKMETMLSAERDATVTAVHVRPGDVINAKDLLIELG